MATEIEAALQLTMSAAAMKDRGQTYTMQASMAKLFASELVNRITARARPQFSSTAVSDARSFPIGYVSLIA